MSATLPIFRRHGTRRRHNNADGRPAETLTRQERNHNGENEPTVSNPSQDFEEGPLTSEPIRATETKNINTSERVAAEHPHPHPPHRHAPPLPLPPPFRFPNSSSHACVFGFVPVFQYSVFQFSCSTSGPLPSALSAPCSRFRVLYRAPCPPSFSCLVPFTFCRVFLVLPPFPPQLSVLVTPMSIGSVSSFLVCLHSMFLSSFVLSFCGSLCSTIDNHVFTFLNECCRSHFPSHVLETSLKIMQRELTW